MEQNNNTQLPAEVKQVIIDDSLTYLASLYTEGYVNERYQDGTLSIPHEWKTIRKAHQAGATEWAQWKVKYDEQAGQKLATEVVLNERVANLVKLQVEFRELKERSDKMEAALEFIKRYGPTDALTIKHIDKVLSSWKGKEVDNDSK